MRRRGLMVVAVPLVPLVLALGGCAAAAEPTPTKSASAAAAPVEEPSPTPTERVFDEASYTFDVPKAEADRLFAIDSVSYDNVPIEERAQFVLYHLEQTEFLANAASYESFRRNLEGTEFDALPTALAPTNTPQEILAFVTALDRLTFGVPQAGNPAYFDQDVAFRLIASQSVSGKTSHHAGKLVTNLSELVAYDGGELRTNDSLMINSLLTTPQVVNASAVATNGQGRPSIDITYTTMQGNTLTETYQWVTVGAKGLWLPQ